MTSDYSTNLTHDQWDLLFPLLPGPKATGRPRTVDLYEVINAILYVLEDRGHLKTRLKALQGKRFRAYGSVGQNPVWSKVAEYFPNILLTWFRTIASIRSIFIPGDFAIFSPQTVSSTTCLSI